MATGMIRSETASADMKYLDPGKWLRHSAAALVLACAFATHASAQDSVPEDQAVIDITQRVIGGNDAAAGQYPSIVALIDADDSGFFTALSRQFCGGTVINQQWVMTAAHCVHNEFGNVINAASLRVVEGSLTLSEDTVQELVVTNIIAHPSYDHNSLDTRNDIALLEMATSLSSTPVALFGGEPDELAGVTAVTAGWGATEFVDGQVRASATTLQQASLPIVTLEVCNVPESYDGLIQPGQMCAGFIEGGVDGCVGDSGGPLYISSGGSQVQVGVTSFGVGCAAPNFYGVYTSVASFIDWIAGFTGGSESGLTVTSSNLSGSNTAGSNSLNSGRPAAAANQSSDPLFGELSGGAASLPGLFFLVVCGALFRRR